MKKRNWIAVTILLGGSAAMSAAGAQQPGAAPDPGARRAVLEQRLRERTAQMVKQRLRLTDDQLKRLQQTNASLEKQRTELFSHERDVRRELRQQLLLGDSANQNKVSQLLDQSMQIERQRLDLRQSEQRELAKFLTPVQRAKLVTLQMGIRRRTQELRGGATQRAGPSRIRPPVRRD
jgi:protein CpxP